MHHCGGPSVECEMDKAWGLRDPKKCIRYQANNNSWHTARASFNDAVATCDWLITRCRQENHILPSPPLYHSFRAPAISLSLIYFHDIFGLGNPWEPELYTIWIRSLRIRGSLILIIIPNGDTILALNSPDPYDSNGATYMCIHAQYKEIRKLPGFCLHVWRKLDRRDMLRIIYR